MRSPKCKVIALGWLSDERFPRACSTSAGCFACKQDGGRARVALGIRRFRPNCTNSNASCPATLHRKGGCPVHQLARSWLQYRLTLVSSTVLSKSKLPIKLSRLGCRKWTWANFNSQQFLWRSCKNHKNHKSIIFTPLLRLFDMACYAPCALITRIEKDL